MDLLLHLFEKDPQCHEYRQEIKNDDPDLTSLTIAISRNPRSSSSISNVADIADLGRDIGKNTNLRVLHIDDLYCQDYLDVSLSGWMFGLLCDGINQNQSIEELTVSNFSHNQWQIGQYLGPFLESSPNLRELVVMTGGGCTRSAENMRLLVSPLLNREGPLDELAFIENGVNDDMVVQLVDVFLNDPRLVPIKLEIAACEFGLIGCHALAKLLRSQSCNMQELIICDNYIDDDGAKCLADALVGNNTLRELSLQGNRITDEGWKLFTKSSCFVRREHERPPPPRERYTY